MGAMEGTTYVHIIAGIAWLGPIANQARGILSGRSVSASIAAASVASEINRIRDGTPFFIPHSQDVSMGKL